MNICRFRSLFHHLRTTVLKQLTSLVWIDAVIECQLSSCWRFNIDVCGPVKRVGLPKIIIVFGMNGKESRCRKGQRNVKFDRVGFTWTWLGIFMQVQFANRILNHFVDAGVGLRLPSARTNEFDRLDGKPSRAPCGGVKNEYGSKPSFFGVARRGPSLQKSPALLAFLCKALRQWSVCSLRRQASSRV